MYREHGDMTGAAQQKAAEHFNPEHSNKVRRIKREDRLKAQDMKEQASLYDAEQVNRAEADAWPKQGSLSDSEFRRELQEARKIFPYVDDVINPLSQDKGESTMTQAAFDRSKYTSSKESELNREMWFKGSKVAPENVKKQVKNKFESLFKNKGKKESSEH